MVSKKELYAQLLNHREREMRTRISLLDWATENEIRNIEGRVTDGNITVDGNSPVRRTCSLTMIVDKNITVGQEKISDLITINKKAKIQVGLRNTTAFKEMGDIIWFNLGVYVLTDVVYTHDLDNAMINITALDKMCLWSGDVGGELPVALNLTELGGAADGKPPTFYEIIRGIVTVFGEQDPGRILIQDVDEKIRRVIQKKTPGTLYFSKKDWAALPSIEGVDMSEVIAIDQGDYVYVYEPFRPVSDQEESFQMNLGQTITQALDLVKNALGNYEYFFDLDGNFIFQEIKNFKNTSFSTDITSIMTTYMSYGAEDNDFDNIIKPIQDITDGDYITNFSQTPYTYSFEESEIATSFTNVPDWKGIKNNFIVYGEAGKKMMHLVIDKKPVSPSIWYVDETELAEAIPAPEYYVGIRNTEGLYGLYLDKDFNLMVDKLEGEQVPLRIFETSFILKDHLTEDYSRVVIEGGKIKFKDEFFPSGETFNGAVLKSQRGCDCLLYSYDSYPKIMKPYRHLNFALAPNGKVFIFHVNGEDRIVGEETERFFFEKIIDGTNTPPPTFLPQSEFLLLDEKMNNRALKVDNEGRLYASNTDLIAERENFFIPDLKGGGVNVIIYNDRLQFDKQFTIAVPYNQPWQQYIIDLGDSIIKSTPQGQQPLLPRWYTELKQFFPLIYKRNDNYWGGSWLKAYAPNGDPIYSGMGDSTIWPYYFDIIDENTELGQFSVEAIGLRTKAVVDEEITMLYPPVRRNYCMLKPSETENIDLMEWLNAKEQPYLILKDDDELWKHFEYAAYGLDAFTKIRELIYTHTSMNETVNISSLPVYFLEPNTKIIAKDEETHTSGDYVIMNINFPLSFDGQQQLSCIKIKSRL